MITISAAVSANEYKLLKTVANRTHMCHINT